MSVGVMSPLGLFGITAPAAQAAAALVPTDLGTLPGGTSSRAVAVSGRVVFGEADTGTESHAFAYDLDATSPSMEDLGTLGGTYTQVEDASGNVVVGASQTAGGAEHAFVYDRGATTPGMLDLGTLGGSRSRAEAVSGRIVVGWSLMVGDIATRAFAYDLDAMPPVMRDLGTFGGTYTEALAAGDNVVVGFSQTADADEADVPFAGDLSNTSLPLRNLGTLGGTEGEALAASGGVVVGYSNLAGDQSSHAFAYDLNAASPSMRDLGTLPGGTVSRAAAVSSSVVAGFSTNGAGRARAFAYDLDAPSPEMLDLGTLGGSDSRAGAVSGKVVVGSSYTVGLTAPRGFAYDLGAAVPSMQELGTLGGDSSGAGDVSGRVVVGSARTAGPVGADHAVVWDLGPAADTAGPDVTIGSPAAGATYTVGDAATAAFSCADPSGVASCTGVLNGSPISNGDPLDTSVTGTFTLNVSGVDNFGNTTSRSALYTMEAVPGGAASAVSGGGVVTTDPGGAGASPAVPLQTAVTAPAQVSGVLTVTPQTTTTPPPAGFSLFGTEVVIAGPLASAASPYQVSFTVDGSVLGGVAPADVQVFRNGLPLTGCTDATAANPDPCVVSRGFAPGGGDALVSVRTSQFSTWSLGKLSYTLKAGLEPVNLQPVVNTARAGSAIPVRFSLGNNRGLDIFGAGFPRTSVVTCGGGPKDEVELTLPLARSVLVYEPHIRQYVYVWKTDKSWKGCRDLVLQFKDGSSTTATFNLR